MGWMIAFAAWIGSGIAAAATAVASLIVTLCATIYTAVAWCVGALFGLFSGITAGLLNGLGILSGNAAIGIGEAIGGISSIAGNMYFTAGAWIEGLGFWFRTFLKAIHFTTLKKLSDIAYLLSSDWRETMNRVYDNIAEFSHALSGNAFFVIHLLENARAVILDTSAMLGRPYDIGELTWVEEFQKFLYGLERQAELYEKNPHEIINDINERLLKPSYDMQSEVWQGLFNTVDNIIEIVDGTVNDIVEIRDGIKKLVSELPESIFNRIHPWVNAKMDRIDHFIDDMYYPTIDRLRSSINMVVDNEAAQDERMKGIVDRLKRPAKYLLESNDLPTKERLEDYEIYAELSTEIYRRPVTDWRKYAKPYTEEFLKIGEMITKPRVLPLWEVPEMPTHTKGEVEPSIGRKSPFPEDV